MKRNIDKFREKSFSQQVLQKIDELQSGKEIKIMHVCGTHEVTIAKWGLREILPKNIKLICGPGCPVCVTSAQEIDSAVKLSLTNNNILTTFGDILRVPGTSISLAEAASQGANIKVIYCIDEAVSLAKKNPKKQVIHFAIGFETTAPTTAVEILNNSNLDNFSIIPSHRLIPSAMAGLLKSGQCQIDGFICPGHVSTIIGSQPYEFLARDFSRALVIGGFEPNDILLSILMILRQLRKKKTSVEIEYTRLVKPAGNPLAIKKMWQVFEPCHIGWRGIGIIPHSGLKLRLKFKKFDAIKKFNLKIKRAFDVRPGCKCGEIMKGLAEPKDCPYFKKQCKPEFPLGACIVSIEGPCFVAYKYGSI